MGTPDGAAAKMPAGRAEAQAEGEAEAGSEQADALRQRIERWVSMSAVRSARAVKFALRVCVACACMPLSVSEAQSFCCLSVLCVITGPFEDNR